MSTRAVVLSLLLIAGLSACGQQRDASARSASSDPKRAGSVGVSTQALISDEAHGSDTPGFFFLPPIAPATTSGTFSPGLSPVVTVEELPPGTRGIIAGAARAATCTTRIAMATLLIRPAGKIHR